MKYILITSLFLFSLISCKKSKKEPQLPVANDTESTTIIIKKTIKKQVDRNITKTLVLGKFNYRTDSTFVKVNPKHSTKTVYLNKTVYNAFLEMYNAAKTDGISLKILSATRNFNEQKAIWERKWNKYKALKPTDRTKKILEYSSMPTSSRHHWGTDIDLNSLSNSYFSSGNGKKEYEWLVAHANSFGFYQVYTDKSNGRTGYNLEKWHWSYLPLADQYLKFYNTHIDYKDILGFEGSNLAKKLMIIEDYVNGISDAAKNYKP